MLQALESLSVADNHLQHLPASMAGLVSLKQLWAYGNHLQSLPADILDLPAIRRKLTAIFHIRLPCTFLLLHTIFLFPASHSILSCSCHVDSMCGNQLHSSVCLSSSIRYQQCADYHVFPATISASSPQLLYCNIVLCILHFATAVLMCAVQLFPCSVYLAGQFCGLVNVCKRSLQVR